MVDTEEHRIGAASRENKQEEELGGGGGGGSTHRQKMKNEKTTSPSATPEPIASAAAVAASVDNEHEPQSNHRHKRCIVVAVIITVVLLLLLIAAISTTVVLLTPWKETSTSSEQQQQQDQTFNLRQFLQDELASNGNHHYKQIVVPPGVYRLQPDQQIHLLLAHLSNVHLVMKGVELVCTETTRAISIHDCHNLTIQGRLTIDYDPLPFTQGRIVAMSADTSVHEIELLEGYPDADSVQDVKYEIFRPDTRTLRFGSYHDIFHTKLGPRRIQIIKGNNNAYEKGDEQVGDIIAIGASHAPHGSIPHAVTIDDSTHITLQDVTLYASNAFGFFETNCTATRYVRCRVDRRVDNDDKPRAEPRIRSLNADAFHSKYAPVGPTLELCTARFMGDDAINVNGDYHMVMESSGSFLRVLAKSSGFNIQIGDLLEIVDYGGQRLPDATAIYVSEAVDVITDQEMDFLSRQRMHEPYKRGMMAIHYVEVDRSISIMLPMGSLIGSTNRMGNGVNVTGCRFGYNRSRGILIKASQATIQNNVIEGCWGEAIKVAPEYWWLESGSSNDVQIVGNVIQNCIFMGIAVYAFAGDGNIAPAGAHNDIVLKNNLIRNVGDLHIWVTSTNGLVLANNRYDPSLLQLENCENVIEST